MLLFLTSPLFSQTSDNLNPQSSTPAFTLIKVSTMTFSSGSGDYSGLLPFLIGAIAFGYASPKVVYESSKKEHQFGLAWEFPLSYVQEYTGINKDDDVYYHHFHHMIIPSFYVLKNHETRWGCTYYFGFIPLSEETGFKPYIGAGFVRNPDGTGVRGALRINYGTGSMDNGYINFFADFFADFSYIRNFQHQTYTLLYTAGYEIHL
jgi:hypothetical protein